MTDLVYKDLSYQLVGIAYKIANQVGINSDEKLFCDAFEKLLQKENILYKRECYIPVKVDDLLVAKRYADFLIDGKIIIEIKCGNYRYRDCCEQLYQYLQTLKLQLGLVLRFVRGEVMVKRILNIRK